MDDKLEFDAVVTRIGAVLGNDASVVVSGRDAGGTGVVAELTGVLRRIGPDPDDPAWGESGPWAFGFEDQKNAFYVDPDAFIGAWGSDALLHIETTFGSIELAGPLTRPDWF